MSRNRRTARLTGGGPSEEIPLTPSEEQVVELIPRESVDGIEGATDTAELESTDSKMVMPPTPNAQIFDRSKRLTKMDTISKTLELERERLDVEKERLSFERERLAVERERLAVEKERLETEKELVQMNAQRLSLMVHQSTL